MLRLDISDKEFFDEAKNEFVMVKGCSVQLEHSLVSLSKWESKWHKPFLGKGEKFEKTDEEVIDYIRCMTITQNVNPIIYTALSKEEIEQIKAYIEDSMTATWFSDKSKNRSNNRTVTSELIYSWMCDLGIPFECEKWHLNRLMTLILVRNEENTPKKKMTKKDILAQNRALNAERRHRMGSRG